MKSNVETGVCKNDACYPADCEQKDKSNREQKGRYKTKRATSHSGKSAKDFNAGGNSDNHRRSRKIGASIHI